MTKTTLVSEFQAEYRIFKKTKQCYMSTVAQQNGTKEKNFTEKNLIEQNLASPSSINFNSNF